MKSLALFLLLILLSFFSIGQENNLTAKKISQLLKQSIKQSSKDKIDVDSNPWLVCNTDSSFFRSDTIILLQSNPIGNYVHNCCKGIGWTFYKLDSFVQLDFDVCKEPPTERITTDKDFYSLTVTNKNSKTIITTFRKQQPIDSFIVVDYKEFYSQNGGKTNGLILVRQK